MEPTPDEISNEHNIAEQIEKDEIMRAFIKALFCDRILKGTRLADTDIQTFFSPDPPPDTSTASGALEAGMRGRRLALTSTRFLAPTPAPTEVGDLICGAVVCPLC